MAVLKDSLEEQLKAAQRRVAEIEEKIRLRDAAEQVWRLLLADGSPQFGPELLCTSLRPDQA